MATLVNVTNANSIDVCNKRYKGPGSGDRVLSCPGSSINIISAEYGRQENDLVSCCGNFQYSFDPATWCLVNPGEQCTLDATMWVNTKCNGTYLSQSYKRVILTNIPL